jgi:hypothetical protein
LRERQAEVPPQAALAQPQMFAPLAQALPHVDVDFAC